MCLVRDTIAATVTHSNGKNFSVKFFIRDEKSGTVSEQEMRVPKDKKTVSPRIDQVVFLKLTKKKGQLVPKKVWLGRKKDTRVMLQRKDVIYSR